MSNIFDVLIGRKILEIMVYDDKECLLIETDIGRYIWHAVGDCCSYSYIHHMPDKSEIIGEIVTGAEDKEMDDLEISNDSGSKTAIYLSSIITTKGHFDIEYRNDSNGYYGGWLELKLQPGD